jgi:hypothetical protein
MKDLAAPLGLAEVRSHSKTDRSQNRIFDWRLASIALSVCLAYFLGAKIGFALTFRPHPVSVLWPPNSILLAALLLRHNSPRIFRPRRFWMAYWIAC